MAATWARPLNIRGAANKTNLVMMFGYARGGYLMMRMTPPLLILKMLMMDATPRAADPADYNEAKAVYPHQGHGRI